MSEWKRMGLVCLAALLVVSMSAAVGSCAEVKDVDPDEIPGDKREIDDCQAGDCPTIYCDGECSVRGAWEIVHDMVYGTIEPIDPLEVFSLEYEVPVFEKLYLNKILDTGGSLAKLDSLVTDTYDFKDGANYTDDSGVHTSAELTEVERAIVEIFRVYDVDYAEAAVDDYLDELMGICKEIPDKIAHDLLPKAGVEMTTGGGEGEDGEHSTSSLSSSEKGHRGGGSGKSDKGGSSKDKTSKYVWITDSDARTELQDALYHLSDCVEAMGEAYDTFFDGEEDEKISFTEDELADLGFLVDFLPEQ